MAKEWPGFSATAQWAFSACGLILLGTFRMFEFPQGEAQKAAYTPSRKEEIQLQHEREFVYAMSKIQAEGTGMVGIAYIEDEICARVRPYFDSRWPIMYESPWKMNKNSGNQFQFVIYNSREELNGNS